jgi:hypothetical protein
MKKNPEIDQARCYTIQVQGQLSPVWLEFFSDLNPQTQEGPEGLPLITLAGKFVDQAALNGALQSLYNLGCILVSVKML